MAGSGWDDMLDEFRALGGTANNIRLAEGPLGRGLFPVDPVKPVTIRIPENLLMPVEDVVFENGAFRVGPQSALGDREKAFMEHYQERFSWGGGGRAEVQRLFEQAQALPADLRRELKVAHRCGPWFEELSDKLVQDQFIASRCITYRDRTVVMPIIELANHGHGTHYDPADGLVLRGTFAGEVLVRYSDADSYGIFLTWGFVTPQPQAMSIALAGKVGGDNLHVERDFGDFRPQARAWAPMFSRESGDARLSFLMVGNRQYPRLCRGIFYKLMRERGYSGFEETFDIMLHLNRMHFLNLLDAVEDVSAPMARMLRRMALFQLETLSFSYGVRAM
jgi:hypothetical protein